MAFSQSSLFSTSDDSCPSLFTVTLFSCWQTGETKQNHSTSSYIMCSVPPPGDPELKGPWAFINATQCQGQEIKIFFFSDSNTIPFCEAALKKKLETKKFQKYFRWEIFIKIFHFVKKYLQAFLSIPAHTALNFSMIHLFHRPSGRNSEVITKERARSCPVGQKSLQAGVKSEGCFQNGNRTEGQGKRE